LGSSFRVRATSASPNLQIRGPFTPDGDRHEVRTSGIPLGADFSGVKEAINLCLQLDIDPATAIRHDGIGKVEPRNRFSGWAMLAREMESEVAGLKSSSQRRYLQHARQFLKFGGEVSKEALIDWVKSADTGSSEYRMRCNTLSKVRNCGVDISLDELDVLRKASKYKSTDPARERVIPTDEEIEAWLDGFQNRAQQWIFAMMATYGLRPHETFHIEQLPDEDGDIVVVGKTKTGLRHVFPRRPDWVDRYCLREQELPEISNQSSESLNMIIPAYMKRYCLFHAGQRCLPNDLRHAWAIRTHSVPRFSGIPVGYIAESMGHSEQIHRRIYHRWIGKQELKQRFKNIRSTIDYAESA
jgi:integrase